MKKTNRSNRKLTKTEIRMLIRHALAAQKKAYAPYSGYLVGAALLLENGTVQKGCNVENASFGAGVCAERNAIQAAVCKGHKAFAAIAVVAGPGGNPTEDYPTPCGICRQALREFVNPKEFPVILAKTEDDYLICTLEELLPLSFGPEML